MSASYLLELTEYTDPYCTWCWGSEPILRKIGEVYGGQVKIGFKMGGLVANIEDFHDPANQIGGPEWREQVAAHWLEASNRHGMPVDVQVWHDNGDETFTSTYPASIAYKSAQFQDEILANRFLRRMREGAAAERRPIHRLEVQAGLAEEAGLDPGQFIKDIKSGRAKKAFGKDLDECRNRGIGGFPTFLIRDQNGKERPLLRGYRRFNELIEVFTGLAGNILSPTFPKTSKDSILAFVRKYNKVALQEILEVFNLNKEDAGKYLASLESEGSLEKKNAGNGFFYVSTLLI